MKYDARKAIVERGNEIANDIVRAAALERCRIGLANAGVPDAFWRWADR